MDVLRVLFWFSIFIMIVGAERGEAQLTTNFYSSTCPGADSIVKSALVDSYTQTQNFSVVSGTLRLFYHDCFVEGCDASIMIESPNAEKYAEINRDVVDTSFKTIIKAKQRLEEVCPGVVSCADILAIAARDAIVYSGGPYFSIELGRRDGLISEKSTVEGNLPESFFNHAMLTANFAKKNLSQFEMVALAGAHTIGISHCKQFTRRLYSQPDPSLDATYAKMLMSRCPEHNQDTPDETIFMDPETPRRFDNGYYKNLVRGIGLFTSDEVLYSDSATQRIVVDFADDQNKFYKAFVDAIIKMGRIEVKTGSEGEIRKDCRAFNS